MVAVTVICFGLAWWIGLYLIERELRLPGVIAIRAAGFGFVIYAVILATESVQRSVVSGGFADGLNWLQSAIAYLPALIWSTVSLAMLKAIHAVDAKTVRWGRLSLALFFAALVAGAITAAPPAARGAHGVSALLQRHGGTIFVQCLLVLSAVALTIVAVTVMWRNREKWLPEMPQHRRWATIFFSSALCGAVAIVPTGLVPPSAVPGAAGADLGLIAGAVLMVHLQEGPYAIHIRAALVGVIAASTLFALNAAIAPWSGGIGVGVMLALTVLTPIALVLVRRSNVRAREASHTPANLAEQNETMHHIS